MSGSTHDGSGFLTIGEVAKILKVSQSWIYKKAKAGIIPHVRLGSVLRFDRNDIERWVSAHRNKGCLKV